MLVLCNAVVHCHVHKILILEDSLDLDAVTSAKMMPFCSESLYFGFFIKPKYKWNGIVLS